ncbi:hypothetical protein B0T26DRAFT_642510 [Lasiosphaeria miniovina]|uniref:Zn(2)-C6 fungal-type domain-containing protein n=1 Tax=Lasiosphaeria miniovina TaxID=1954250 RepID=A0AA40E241_9PEZI|nr:uncharacterized protein B0T26DRAFT_642510 [Lasiosphaeria miniovina]KAK0722167.1 hypothetical protein B0T26DRAFT_642510 [Lasiosphaeria miniovina]
MQAVDYCGGDSRVSLGKRRGVSDLARFPLDLTWARADSESAARLRSYPSPPMSGSPPLPPKSSQEAAERSLEAYQATTHDVYRGIPATTRGDERVQASAPLPPRPFPPDAPERMPYPFYRSEGSVNRPLTYPQHHPQLTPQPTYLPAPGPGVTAGPLPTPQAYPVPPHHPMQEPMHQTSPKPQRKTKGHVASACVPCKKAHLRCRPCSRCLTNGKEEACIDVQHRKRGRPRLRDEREAKFDGPRFGSAADAMRRPIQSLYSPGSSIGMAYEENIRRTQSYRVLKSQPAETIAPRFPDRGSVSDANIFPAPLSISTRPPELAAFLTVDFEFAKSSSTFRDAIGRQSLSGFKLADFLAPGDREKASSLQQMVHNDQKRKDPTYLPPILGMGKDERVIQALGFSSEEISRYPLDWHEVVTFVGHDGQARQVSMQMGLVKKESVYFVVVVLSLPTRQFQYPTPSPNPREMSYSYQPLQQPYSQPTPVSATFDPRGSRPGDGGYGPRQAAAPGAPPSLMLGLSPGLASSYTASPSRPDYPVPGPPYQVPRSELHTAIHTHQGVPYQLPPIRNQHPNASQQEPSYQPRAERSRVDIGGLLDRSGPPNPQQQHRQQQ